MRGVFGIIMAEEATFNDDGGGRVSPMIPQCNIHMICCGHGQRDGQRMRERGNKRADNAAVQWKLGEDQRRRSDQGKCTRDAAVY